jgi:hypothetical protein
MSSEYPKIIFKTSAIIITAVFVELYIGGYFSRSFGESLSSRPNLVLGEEAANFAGKDLVSENYKISQIYLGGDGDINMNSDNKDDILSISDITSEIVNTKEKEKNEIKMILSWKTSKAAISKIEYAKNGESVPEAENENDYGLFHVAVFSSLNPATVYSYTIKSHDHWGNLATSDKFVFYTGAPDISLIDVLANAAQKAFGWALKKN